MEALGPAEPAGSSNLRPLTDEDLLAFSLDDELNNRRAARSPRTRPLMLCAHGFFAARARTRAHNCMQLPRHAITSPVARLPADLFFAPQ